MAEHEGLPNQNQGGEGQGGQNLEQLQSQLQELQNTVKSLHEAKSQLEAKLEEYESELLSDEYLEWKERGKGEPSGKEEEEEIDLDTASAKDIIKYVEKKYKGDLESAIEEISGKLDETEERVGLALARIDIELTALKHPDFWEYKDRMQKLAEENPTWSAEKCYKQAKLGAKMEEEERKKEEEKKAEEE
ncbi:MAG: hypothetical protein DRN14_03310, partial [Thermoplasmata archaeon]